MSVNLPEFEKLAKIAKENPEKLDEIRREACEQLIQSAPKEYQRKLRGLQFKIDMERRKAKTPMAACVKISEMMHESFGELRDALNEAQSIKAPSLKTVFDGSGASTRSPESSDQKESENQTVVQFPALT